MQNPIPAEIWTIFRLSLQQMLWVFPMHVKTTFSSSSHEKSALLQKFLVLLESPSGYSLLTAVTFLIIKPTRCTNFSNLFLDWKSTWFRQFLCPSSGVFHCTHSNGICHTGLLTACEQDHIPLLCVQWKTPDDGQRNCPKHVEFQSKN